MIDEIEDSNMRPHFKTSFHKPECKIKNAMCRIYLKMQLYKYFEKCKYNKKRL